MWQVVLVIILHIMAFAYFCGKISQRVNKNEKEIERNSELLGELLERVSKIEGRLDPYIQKKSPLTLTEKGTKLLKESGVEAYIEKNKDTLIKKFDDSISPLDIQEKAKKVMNEEIQKSIAIKNYIYKEGEELESVVRVAGIALRDAVIKEKNIQV